MTDHKLRSLQWQPVPGTALPDTPAVLARALPMVGLLDEGEAGKAKAVLKAVGGDTRGGLLESGIPGFPDAPPPAEYAQRLMRLAAEVELEFLVQYLYAAFSLPSVSPWRGTLVTLAKEEMGHLLALQNLLVSIGQTPHLQAETTGSGSAWFPFAAAREPWTPTVMKRFLVAESPLDAELPNGVIAPVRTSHVGAIYATLYWLLLPTDDVSTGTWRDFPADIFVAAGLGHIGTQVVTSGGNQIAADEWGGDSTTGTLASGQARLIIATVTSNTDALAVVSRVAAQGEGSPPSMPWPSPSHYARLLAMFNQSQAPGSPAFATNVISNPTLQPPGAPGLLTNPVAIAWARLADLQYKLILLDIAQAYVFPKDAQIGGSVVRSDILFGGWIIDDMKSISSIATKLGGIPAGTVKGPAAGAPFVTPATLTVSDPGDGWKQFATVLVQAIDVATSLASNDPLAASLLATDKARLKWIGDNKLI
jgi:hypothetical protein